MKVDVLQLLLLPEVEVVEDAAGAVASPAVPGKGESWGGGFVIVVCHVVVMWQVILMAVMLLCCFSGGVGAIGVV